MASVKVIETFVSLQGESTYAGLSCFFIRLAGCNLRCRYCDTTNAYEGGRDIAVEALVKEAALARTAIIEITGGEPLLQAAFPELATALRDGVEGRPVLVETNGSRDLSVVPDGVAAIVDVKSPGSGEGKSFDMANLARLRPSDEVKFVLTDRPDYEWARDFLNLHGLAARCRAVLFSPAWGALTAGDLGRWILEDRLPVRLQLQLHKVLGMK